MAKEDYYKQLNIDKNASDAEIKKSYRRLAMKYHPDRNKDTSESAEKKFKQIKEAYEILADPKKRAAYDQFGHAGVDPSMGGGGGAESFSDIFGDVFGDIFGGARGGGGGGRSHVQAGADLRYNLELTLEEAVAGTEAKIRVPVLISCKECKGSGAKKGSSPVTCTTCQGQGKSECSKVFSLYNKPARLVVAKVNRLKILAENVMGRGVFKTLKPCRSKFHRVLIPEIEYD